MRSGEPFCVAVDFDAVMRVCAGQLLADQNNFVPCVASDLDETITSHQSLPKSKGESECPIDLCAVER